MLHVWGKSVINHTGVNFYSFFNIFSICLRNYLKEYGSQIQTFNKYYLRSSYTNKNLAIFFTQIFFQRIKLLNTYDTWVLKTWKLNIYKNGGRRGPVILFLLRFKWLMMFNAFISWRILHFGSEGTLTP